MRGRKPEPTALKLVKGNPGRRPLNANEAKPPAAVPDAPDHLSEEGRIEWERVVQRLADLDLMTDLDRAALAAYCQSYGRWVQAERVLSRMAQDHVTYALMITSKKNNAIQNPIVGTANHAMAEMMRYAAEFGMTPSARSRINIGIGTGAGASNKDDDEPPKLTGTAADFF